MIHGPSACLGPTGQLRAAAGRRLFFIYPFTVKVCLIPNQFQLSCETTDFNSSIQTREKKNIKKKNKFIHDLPWGGGGTKERNIS